MSIINFKCESEMKETLKTSVWKIIREHYLTTIYPHTMDQKEWKRESEEVYNERMDEIMKAQLCNVMDTDDGFSFEFDSTEDAGFFIADDVYQTGPRYMDDGLTYLHPIFEKIMKDFPDVCFTAHCECYDKWSGEEYDCSYDGKEFVSEECEESEEDWCEE